MNVLACITPALFTSRLTSAHSAATAATRCGSVMSRATGITPGSATWPGWRAAPNTLAAPRPTSSRAYARPSPRFAPVTKATDPAIRMASLPAACWPSRVTSRHVTSGISFHCPSGHVAGDRRGGGWLLDQAELGAGELGVDEELERVALLVLVHEAAERGAAGPGQRGAGGGAVSGARAVSSSGPGIWRAESRRRGR